MQKVKISIPGFKSQINISQFTDNYENIVDGFGFYVNSKHMDNPDFWFVIEDLETNSETCNVNPKNIIFFHKIDSALSYLRPDAVILSTPPFNRMQDLKVCAKFKLPILVEKPLTINLE